jgi:hypothetical protein
MQGQVLERLYSNPTQLGFLEVGSTHILHLNQKPGARYELKLLVCEVSMRNFLIISDLSYLQPINESAIVLGGKVYADTFAATTAERELATADAGAVARGDNTLASTQTSTTVGSRGRLDYSRANATAIAYARTGNQIASSRSSSSSIGLYITNP